MNLQDIIIKSKREPESLRQSDDRQDDISLTDFREDDSIAQHLKDLCEDLVGLSSPGQVRAVLSLYLPEIEWGGTEV